jgi:hypothetical protein
MLAPIEKEHWPLRLGSTTSNNVNASATASMRCRPAQGTPILTTLDPVRRRHDPEHAWYLPDGVVERLVLGR